MGRPRTITAAYLDEMKDLKLAMVKSGIKMAYFAMKIGYIPDKLSMCFKGKYFMPEEKRNIIRELISKLND
ncbi:MAG: hypothetical protein ACRDE7_00290 [Sphingobacterium sp.]